MEASSVTLPARGEPRASALPAAFERLFRAEYARCVTPASPTPRSPRRSTSARRASARSFAARKKLSGGKWDERERHRASTRRRRRAGGHGGGADAVPFAGRARGHRPGEQEGATTALPALAIPARRRGGGLARGQRPRALAARRLNPHDPRADARRDRARLAERPQLPGAGLRRAPARAVPGHVRHVHLDDDAAAARGAVPFRGCLGRRLRAPGTELAA